MTYPTITPLPTAPSRSQDPDAFASTADTFVAALPDLVTDVNAAGAYIDSKAISVGNAFQGVYSAGTTYSIGQSVLYNDVFYLSLVNSNTGNTPDSSPSQWVEIAGAAGSSAGGTHEFVATGTISTGDVVALRSDGTVEVIASTPSDPPSAGTPTVFESALAQTISSTFDSTSGKVIVTYQDGGNSYYSTAIVGTVSGTSISFGTPVVFETLAAAGNICCFDSFNNKVVVAYRQYDGLGNFYGISKVGAVSGTSISFGSPQIFKSGNIVPNGITFDSNSNKVVIAYVDGTNSNFGTAIVGTVSGSSISFGTEVVFNSANTTAISATFDSNSNKVILAYRDIGNSSFGTAIVGTVSGTSISFGTEVVFESASTPVISATFDSNSNKVVIAYQDGGNFDYGTAVVGTVSGTSISFGTPVVFNSASVGALSATFDSSSNKVVIAYRDQGNSSFGTAIVGTVSGTSISFGTEVVFESASTSQPSATFDSNSNRVVVTYQDSGNSSYGTTSVISTFTSNYSDWIGISTQNIANTGSGLITILGGVNENQTGLTPKTVYYVSENGSLATSGNVKIGKALSSTKLLITEANT